MRAYCIVLLTLALAACSSAPPAPAQARQQTEGAKPESPAQEADTLEMSGIKLYLYDKVATPGADRDPLLSVEADKFAQDADKTWRFTKARATMHAKKPGDDNIVFDAGSGTLREEESALLDQGVKTQIGPMAITMDSVIWKQGMDGMPGMASSDKPVTVLDPSMQLFAQQFRLYPEASQFALLEVHGEVAFVPPPPEGAPTAPAALPPADAAPGAVPPQPEEPTS